MHVSGRSCVNNGNCAGKTVRGKARRQLVGHCKKGVRRCNSLERDCNAKWPSDTKNRMWRACKFKYKSGTKFTGNSRGKDVSRESRTTKTGDGKTKADRRKPYTRSSTTTKERSRRKGAQGSRTKVT